VPAIAAAWLSVAAAPRLAAQEQAAPAESLFEEGRALLAQQKYPEACAKLAESEKLDPAVGTLLNLGDCYEKMGRIATAWAVFKQASSMARAGKQPGREKIAADRALSLEPKLPRLSIRVAHPAPKLEVRRDGLLLGEAEWAGSSPSALTLDPGVHEIVAVAPGKKPWTTQVTLEPDGKTASVDVPELEVDELAERAPLKPAASSDAASIAAVNAHDRNVQRAIGLVIGGIGVVTAVVGVPFGAKAISQNKTAESECPTDTTCSRQGQSDSQSAVSSGLISTILIAVGAGVAVGGAIVFLAAPAPKAEPRPAALRIAPAFGPDGGGLRLYGSF
jgi:hypothetical protein